MREYFSEEHIPDTRVGLNPVSMRTFLEAAFRIVNTGVQ